MKFIDPNVEIILEEDPYKKIELAGRTCYKSEPVGEDSARRFFGKLVKSKHTAMVEHAAFAFRLKGESGEHLFRQLQFAKFLNTTEVDDRLTVSGNIRALNECELADVLLIAINAYDPYFRDLCYSLDDAALSHTPVADIEVIPFDKYNEYLPTQYEFLSHTYTTFKFTEDRGVTHEHVRHRPASFGQESTRYCNYGKDGFGNELTYMLPTTFDSWAPKFQGMFNGLMSHIEYVYLTMVDSADPDHLQPQQARAVLPQCIKADIVITADGLEWLHIFNLRYKGTTGKPHPDMQHIMTEAYPLYRDNVYNLELL